MIYGHHMTYKSVVRKSVQSNAGLGVAVAERAYRTQTGQIVALGAIAGLRDLELMRHLYLGSTAAARTRRSA